MGDVDVEPDDIAPLPEHLPRALYEAVPLELLYRPWGAEKPRRAGSALRCGGAVGARGRAGRVMTRRFESATLALVRRALWLKEASVVLTAHVTWPRCDAGR
jgi:hypothetical protein